MSILDYTVAEVRDSAESALELAETEASNDQDSDTGLDGEKQGVRWLGSAGMVEVAGRRQQLEEEEDLQTFVRTRRMLANILLMSPVFLAADWLIATHIEPSDLAPILLTRVLVQVSALLLYASLRPDKVLSRQKLLAVERITTSGFAAFSSILCVLAGGISSIYAIGITIILVGRSTMRTDRMRDAAPSMIAAVAIHPCIIVISALVSPSIAAQFLDVRQVALGLTMVTTNIIIMTLVLSGGDTIWKLRRQLFEARQVGRYQLKELLGAGGMGEVWSAYFPALRRDVAIKILRGVGKAVLVSRFEREAQATAMLTHPNTVRVLDFGATDDGLWYYAMELLDGENLAALVRREGALEPKRAAHMVLQATRALAEAHGRGICHRDIKPENLFVTHIGGEKDFIKLLDFGIASIANDEGTILTASGSVMGTPQFIAPEVANGLPADVRTDIYGMGAVLYFLLTARPPYTGESLAHLLTRAAKGGAPTPSALLGRQIDPDIERVAMHCLSTEPSARYQSASELAEALASCQGYVPGS